MATFLPQLAACGQLAAEGASAIIYIEPNGFPGSVGLAAGTALDEDVGDCMVQTIRRWKMSATLPGRVMRATFSHPAGDRDRRGEPRAASRPPPAPLSRLRAFVRRASSGGGRARSLECLRP